METSRRQKDCTHLQRGRHAGDHRVAVDLRVRQPLLDDANLDQAKSAGMRALRQQGVNIRRDPHRVICQQVQQSGSQATGSNSR